MHQDRVHCSSVFMTAFQPLLALYVSFIRVPMPNSDRHDQNSGGSSPSADFAIGLYHQVSVRKVDRPKFRSHGLSETMQ